MRFVYHHRTQGTRVEAVHIRGVAGGLEELGHQVTIVGPPGVVVESGEAQSVSGAAPKSWKPRLWEQFSRRCPEALFELAEVGYGLAAFPRLSRTCRRAGADAVYERYAYFNLAGLLAARARRVPLLLEVNDTVEVERERHGHRLLLRGLARRMENRVFKGAAALFVVSTYLRELLIARGLPAGKIVVTPNAIDPRHFDPQRGAAAGIRERLGLQGRVVVGFVGSFLSWHGIELLMRVLPRILERHTAAAFLLVGDGSRRAAAEAEVRALGLEDRVRFTGHVPHAAVPDYLAARDVGLMPHSNRFGSPVKIFEYMAMGVVPVGPRFGPLEEAIDDGVNGLLFNAGDEDGLEDGIDRLLSEPAARRRMAAAARARVLERHLWVHNAAAIMDRVFPREDEAAVAARESESAPPGHPASLGRAAPARDVETPGAPAQRVVGVSPRSRA